MQGSRTPSTRRWRWVRPSRGLRLPIARNVRYALRRYVAYVAAHDFRTEHEHSGHYDVDRPRVCGRQQRLIDYARRHLAIVVCRCRRIDPFLDVYADRSDRRRDVLRWHVYERRICVSEPVQEQVLWIDRCRFESGIPGTLSYDKSNHGISVYCNPHTSIKCTDTIFERNWRSSIKQYSGGSSTGFAPHYTSYSGVNFKNAPGFCIETCSEDTTTTVTNCTWDEYSGPMAVRSHPQLLLITSNSSG